MNRWLTAGLAVLALMLLVACGGSDTSTSTPAATPATPEAAAPVAPPAATPATGGITVGASVAAPWGGAGSLYLGTVQSIAGTTAKVLYADDNIVRDVAVAQLLPVVARTWAVNDKVLAVWSAGKFYPGTVTAVKANSTYTVKWDDGSSPSDVVAGKIIAPPAAATAVVPAAAGVAGAWKVNDVVEVLWNGTWFRAKVIEVKDGKYKITYEGYDHSWDELVGNDRIRAVQAQ